MDENWTTQVNEVMMSGRCGIYSAILPLNPIYACLDLGEKISDAVIADNITLSTTGIITLVNGGMTLNVSTITDSAIIRIEHNYAPPDGFKIPIPTLHISDYHYWKVDGIIPDGFDASATIGYNGSFSTSGYVDNNLITNSEDSLVVLYRASSKYDWSVITDYTQNFFGSHNDKVGNFTINHLQKGEYAFGIYDYDKVDSIDTLETDACIVLSSPLLPDKTKEKLIIYPNPTADSFTLDYELLSSSARLNIFSMEGKAVLSETLQKGNHKRTISTSSWRNGIYLIQVADTLNNIISTRLVVGN